MKIRSLKKKKKWQGQTVLLRVDFNVDLDENGKILSDFRMRAVLPTMEHLIGAAASKIIIISHLGEPKGKDSAFSLSVVAEKFKEILKRIGQAH